MVLFEETFESLTKTRVKNLLLRGGLAASFFLLGLLMTTEVYENEQKQNSFNS